MIRKCVRCNMRFAEWGSDLCYPCKRQRNAAEIKRKKMYYNRAIGGEKYAQSKRWSSDYLR